tara:strand:+ start:13351 stop:13746 length:396 start_codon:yes stop_codon:yes gene_type:complete
MSKSARAKLGNILGAMGYSHKKILKAIGYPKCKAISVSLPSWAGSSLHDSIIVKEGETQITVALSESKESSIAPPVFPLLSHIEFPGIFVFQFRYSDKMIRKIISTGPVSIPEAPGWMGINFIEPKYPVSA